MDSDFIFFYWTGFTGLIGSFLSRFPEETGKNNPLSAEIK